MKILCVADASDPLVYSPNIVERYKDVDFIIGAGDLPLKYYEYIITTLNKPLYFVFGNHHAESLKQYKGTRYFDGVDHLEFNRDRYVFGIGGEFLDGQVKRDRSTGLLLAGLGGSMRYNSGENQFSEFQMGMRIAAMVPRLVFNRLRYGRGPIYCDPCLCGASRQRRCLPYRFQCVPVVHAPLRPRFLLHGHVHLLDMNELRTARYGGTEIINVYGLYVLRGNKGHGS